MTERKRKRMRSERSRQERPARLPPAKKEPTKKAVRTARARAPLSSLAGTMPPRSRQSRNLKELRREVTGDLERQRWERLLKKMVSDAEDAGLYEALDLTAAQVRVLEKAAREDPRQPTDRLIRRLQRMEGLDLDDPRVMREAWREGRVVRVTERIRRRRCADCGLDFLVYAVRLEDGHYVHPHPECHEALGRAVRSIEVRLSQVAAFTHTTLGLRSVRTADAERGSTRRPSPRIQK